MGILGWMKSTKGISFLSGIAASIVSVQIVKSPKTRELCVKAIAKGMRFQKDAEVAIQSMKEDAEDLCHDAKIQAAIEVE